MSARCAGHEWRMLLGFRQQLESMNTQVTNRRFGWWRWWALALVLALGACTTPVAEKPVESVNAGGGEVGSDSPERDLAGPKPEPAPTPKPYVTPGLITQVDLQRVLELQDDGKLLLVDVRPPLFYSMGHIPNAISLPRKKYESVYPSKKGLLDSAVAAKRVIVLYCANVNCPDAYTVGKFLSREGYSVSIYKGGWDEWKMTGF